MNALILFLVLCLQYAFASDAALMNAAYTGDISKVRAAINSGANVNADNSGWTPLMYATKAGHLEIVKLLVKHGANAEKASNMAAKSKNFKFLSVLSPGDGRLPASYIPTNPKTEVMGFDVTLSAEAFRKKYGEKIKSCKNVPYKLDVVSKTLSLDTKVCQLKSGGVAKFFMTAKGSMIYRFEEKAKPKSKIKLRLAAEKLEKKANKKADLSTYTGGMMGLFCAFTVPFAKGEVSVVSANVFNEILKNNMRTGARNERCTLDLAINVDFKSLVYDNLAAKELMKQSLILKRDAKERKAAGEFSL